MKKSFMPVPKDVHGETMNYGSMYSCTSGTFLVTKVGRDCAYIKDLHTKKSTVIFGADCKQMTRMTDEDAVMFVLRLKR